MLLGNSGCAGSTATRTPAASSTTSTERFHTGTYALATDNLDIDGRGSGGLVSSDRYGKARLRPPPRRQARLRGHRPVRTVRNYLAAPLRLHGADADPFHADYVDHAGSGRPGPADQSFWVTSTRGAGRQSLTWDVRHGEWSVPW